jgi:outer membrane receptor protein involved in Fe transport
MRFNKGSLLAGTIMAGAMIATPAMAQESDIDPALQSGASENVDSDEDFIVVTGSRIQRRDIDTAAPVAVVDAEEFQLTGVVNVENVINALPQVVPGTTSFSNNPGNGAATLNLRGLGATRTLVLVNGRRWTFFDVNQVVDLNTIPQFMLESVDTVTGGASAVYGSDALAGVVNFRLKEVQGVEMNSQYSITERGDGARFQIAGAIGSDFADGRGNVTAYAEYFERDPIFQGDRGFSEFALFGEGNEQFFPGGSSLPPETRLTYLGDGDVTGTAFENNGLAIFGSPGDIRDYRTPQDFYNYAPVNYLQLPQERYLVGGNANYEVNDSLEIYGEVSYVNNRVAAELAPTPILVNTFLDIEQLVNDGFINDATAAQFRQIDATEPGDAQNDGQVDVQVRRRLVEAGARNNLDERNAFRVVTGARGAITDYLSYDAYYLFARTRNSNIQQGNASLSRFTAGVNGTADNPINIFGANTLTPDMVDSFRIQAQNGDISTLQVMSGVLSGTFGDFALGAAEPIGFAAGVERRIVSAQFLPDTFLASGDVAGFNAGEPTDGGYDVNEVYAELIVPFETESGFRVELNGAARYSDYSLDAVGGVWTYAGGIQVQPIPDVTFRGQYQRAVRAPNVGELFGGFANNFPAADDPCATTAASSGGLRSICAANGVPTALLDDLGSGDPAVVSAAQGQIQPDPQIATSIGGNPNLFEETSDSYTVGVVLEPSFIPGLTVTADYFDITIEDAIITLAFQDSLDLCFIEAQDLSDPRCAPFRGTRDASGSFSRNNLPLQGDANIGELSTSGVDLVVNYNTDLGFSLLSDDVARLNVNFIGTWTDENNLRPDPTDPTVVTRCAGQFGLTCGNPQATFKWVSRVSYIEGPMTVSTRWRHLSGTDVDDPIPGEEDGLGQFINAYDLIDLTLRFDATETFTITAGVNNLFDTLPSTPVFENGVVVNDTNSLLVGDDNSEQANTFPSTFDVLGRDFFVGVQFRF